MTKLTLPFAFREQTPVDKNIKDPMLHNAKWINRQLHSMSVIQVNVVSTGNTGCITISFIRCLGLKCAKLENAYRQPI